MTANRTVPTCSKLACLLAFVHPQWSAYKPDECTTKHKLLMQIGANVVVEI